MSNSSNGFIVLAALLRASPKPTPTPTPTPASASSSDTGLLIVLFVVIFLLAAGVVTLLLRLRQRPDATGAFQQGGATGYRGATEHGTAAGTTGTSGTAGATGIRGTASWGTNVTMDQRDTERRRSSSLDTEPGWAASRASGGVIEQPEAKPLPAPSPPSPSSPSSPSSPGSAEARRQRDALARWCMDAAEQLEGNAVLQLLQLGLEEAGYEIVAPTGGPFDPKVHEVAQHRPTSDLALDRVVAATVWPGYRLDGQTIRRAKVVVYRVSSPQSSSPA
jgi:hypothetical protein